jgi:hypothetical protein
MTETTSPKPLPEPVADNIGLRSYVGCMVGGKPAVACYDEVTDLMTVVDVDHPFYPQAMAAFSIIEMAFAPVLQEKPKKTLIHVDRPKLIRGFHS